MDQGHRGSSATAREPEQHLIGVTANGQSRLRCAAVDLSAVRENDVYAVASEKSSVVPKEPVNARCEVRRHRLTGQTVRAPHVFAVNENLEDTDGEQRRPEQERRRRLLKTSQRPVETMTPEPPQVDGHDRAERLIESQPVAHHQGATDEGRRTTKLLGCCDVSGEISSQPPIRQRRRLRPDAFEVRNEPTALGHKVRCR